VISRPDTPLPWINYLGSEDYFGIISNTAGGYSFYRDARLRRLTRYRYNNAPFDVGGRYLYLRDSASGGLWSPSWQPVRSELVDYRCRHRLGYTVIGARRGRIDAETLYFVPLGETLEVWRTRITNRRPDPAELSLFSVVEFCLWDAWDDATNFQRNYSNGEVEVDDEVIYHKTEYRSAATTSPTSPAPPSSRASTRNATPSSDPSGGGNDPVRSSRGGRATRSPTAGRRAARTTSN
jgi:cellobiose phosphorylase